MLRSAKIEIRITGHGLTEPIVFEVEAPSIAASVAAAEDIVSRFSRVLPDAPDNLDHDNAGDHADAPKDRTDIGWAQVAQQHPELEAAREEIRKILQSTSKKSGKATPFSLIFSKIIDDSAARSVSGRSFAVLVATVKYAAQNAGVYRTSEVTSNDVARCAERLGRPISNPSVAMSQASSQHQLMKTRRGRPAYFRITPEGVAEGVRYLKT